MAVVGGIMLIGGKGYYPPREAGGKKETRMLEDSREHLTL